MLNVAIICGGISEERGISLNSARSILDHTSSLSLKLTMLYINPEGKYYQITASQLYSNTPSDFDFKLSQLAVFLEETALIKLLKTMDLVFPLVHGAFGENGTLQRFLETHHIPFVGSSSHSCQRIFNKHTVKSFLSREGFASLPSLSIQTKETPIEPFWKKHHLKEAVLKPTESGSSIGVTYVSSLAEAKTAIAHLWDQGFHELLLEPYSQDKEFTVCVLQNDSEEPVALIPIEIDIGEKRGVILDFRRKYLPTADTHYYCPPRFSEDIVAKIRTQAESLFKKLGLKDFVRIDGWVSSSGDILFSDFNPISGMEQNSFLFQQAAKVDLSHSDLIQYILNHTLHRYHNKKKLLQVTSDVKEKTPVYILMGGTTAERQVSVMSGTNVFLKLRHHPLYDPTAFLLEEEHNIWQLPYAYTLHHTMEEIKEHCTLSAPDYYSRLKQTIREKLGLSLSFSKKLPICMHLKAFLDLASQEKAFVFIALHGGIGEDGTLQKLLEDYHLPFNGSGSSTSAICMDKKTTALLIKELNHPSILSMEQFSFAISSLKTASDLTSLWKAASSHFHTEDLLVKPQCDGCSAGVLRLRDLSTFESYIQACQKNHKTFKHSEGLIELSLSSEHFLLEPFIHTDKITIQGIHLKKDWVSGWCEMTIGILEKEGVYSALPPSITVSASHILSLEEKFQGGTGINITPPPEDILPLDALYKVQESACLAAKTLGIQNYARLDLFVECKTGVIRVIEANTLPALTPSTVLFHQALHHSPSLSPQELLSSIITHASSHSSTIQPAHSINTRSHSENVLYSCQT
jgi:D-alanine--D-alanine ligase